jgi:hypothetical protein
LGDCLESERMSIFGQDSQLPSQNHRIVHIQVSYCSGTGFWEQTTKTLPFVGLPVLAEYSHPFEKGDPRWHIVEEA